MEAAAETPTLPLTIIRASTAQHQLGAFKLACAMHPETDFRHMPFNPEKAFHKLGGWMYSERNALLLAMRGDDAVGMLQASTKEAWFSDDEFASEDCLFVRADARGSRSAYRLVGEFLAWARERGLKHARAGVATGTGEAAERIYMHHGMRPMGGNFVIHFEGGHEQG